MENTFAYTTIFSVYYMFFIKKIHNLAFQYNFYYLSHSFK